MLESFGQIALKCWKSRLGRLLFFIHLLYAVAGVGYFYNNFPHSYPFIFRGWWEILFLLNWPQIMILNDVFSFFDRPENNRFTDSVTMFLISIPWWLYGFAAEEGARMIRRRFSY